MGVVDTDYRQTFWYRSLPPVLDGMEVKKGVEGWREEGRKWRGVAGRRLVEMRSAGVKIIPGGGMSGEEGEIIVKITEGGERQCGKKI